MRVGSSVLLELQELGEGRRGETKGEDCKMHDFMAVSLLILCIYGRLLGIANGGREGVEEPLCGCWLLILRHLAAGEEEEWLLCMFLIFEGERGWAGSLLARVSCREQQQG